MLFLRCKRDRAGGLETIWILALEPELGSVLGIMVRWGVLDDADMNKNMDGGSLCTDAGWKGDGKQRYAFKAHIWFSGRPKGIM